MANLPKNKKQVNITLPVEVLDWLQQLADNDMLLPKRSMQASKVIIEAYKQAISTKENNS